MIAAHWKFYNGEEVDAQVLDVDKADLALLPFKLAGALQLKNRPGWRPVYYDDTAVLLARDGEPGRREQDNHGSRDRQHPVRIRRRFRNPARQTLDARHQEHQHGRRDRDHVPRLRSDRRD